MHPINFSTHLYYTKIRKHFYTLSVICETFVKFFNILRDAAVTDAQNLEVG
jgi:hypothetical protein